MSAIIGIRREDKNIWERRAALTPDHVRTLIARGFRVLVESSPIRVFPDDAYRQAGAEVVPDIADADIVFAVKEIPRERIEPYKTYLFFSHTIKGQRQNMPMLARLLDQGCTLLDYEKIVDAHHRRLVFFGRFAGYAGMIDGLWALGQRLLAEGVQSPFAQLLPAHRYDDLDAIRVALKDVGKAVRALPADHPVFPLVVGITGYGNVSQGAQAMCDALGGVRLTPEELPALFHGTLAPQPDVHVVVFEERHMFRHVRDDAFDLDHYFAHPEEYVGAFARYLPYLTLLTNAIYWDPRCPRLITLDDVDQLYTPEVTPRLRVIADITCDPEGAVQCTTHCTSPDAPVYVYDVLKKAPAPGVVGTGPVILAVDNLPCELPADASRYFGDQLLPFAETLAASDLSLPFEALKLPRELSEAIVAHQGQLTPGFYYLREPLQKYVTTYVPTRMPEEAPEADLGQVLVLGAGLVARSLVRYLLETTGCAVHVVDQDETRALSMVAGQPRGSAEAWDASDHGRLREMVREAALVVSLLPAPLHPRVAEVCIDARVPMVTASYVSDAMRGLDARAKEAGVTLLNEVGLDPGIDHMSAKVVIDRVHRAGGKVRRFQSYCGGLPDFSADNNPWRYKFSWSPRGVLTAATNGARYLADGKVVEVPGPELFTHYDLLDVPECGAFEAYPNRDSVPYRDVYGIPEAETMFRGTLRHVGHCETWHWLSEHGFLADAMQTPLAEVSAQDWFAGMLGVDPPLGTPVELARRLALPASSAVLRKLKWLGLWDDAPLGLPPGTPVDVLTRLMSEKLTFAVGERDLVVLHHAFGVEMPGEQPRTVTATLIVRGDPDGDSAMAQTVGLPTALAAEMILTKRFTEPGVHIPTTPSLYEPILAALADLDIVFHETTWDSAPIGT